jgi:hypothetical protein
MENQVPPPEGWFDEGPQRGPSCQAQRGLASPQANCSAWAVRPLTAATYSGCPIARWSGRSVPPNAVAFNAVALIAAFGHARRCHQPKVRGNARRNGRALRSPPPEAVAYLLRVIFNDWGLHLTGVNLWGGPPSCRHSLSPLPGRVSGLVPHRCGLPGLPGVAPMACRVRLPSMRQQWWLAARRWPVHVLWMRRPYIGDRRHYL